jgi:hypothetical protein
MAEASLGGAGGSRPSSAAGTFGFAGFAGRLVAIGGLTLLGVAAADKPASRRHEPHDAAILHRRDDACAFEQDGLDHDLSGPEPP